MENEVSVHDNILESYLVDAKNARITFCTRYYDGEKTDVIWEGVLAYHFESDVFHSILFDIDEVEALSCFDEYRQLFDRLKNYGWPASNYQNREELGEILASQSIQGWRIRSSYGIEGFVWAKTCQRLSADE